MQDEVQNKIATIEKHELLKFAPGMPDHALIPMCTSVRNGSLAAIVLILIAYQLSILFVTWKAPYTHRPLQSACAS
jgi:hypothetical protein